METEESHSKSISVSSPNSKVVIEDSENQNSHDSDLAIDELDAIPAKGRYSNTDFLCSLISVSTYLLDFSMDIIVAVYFHRLGVERGEYHHWYFGLTLTFIIFPSLIMSAFSLRWYLMDRENKQLPPVSHVTWFVRISALVFQLSPVLRHIDAMKYGLLSRYYQCKSSSDEFESFETPTKGKVRTYRSLGQKYYRLMLYEDADASLLRLFECFMESAPQLVLQFYILLKDPRAIHLDTERITFLFYDEANGVIVSRTIILTVSVLSSLVSIAWSFVVYHRSLRYTYVDKKNLTACGSLFQFIWHLTSISSRVLALSLFASVYPKLIGVVCAFHWLAMTTWVISQNTKACQSKWEEVVFALVLGIVYIFSFFNAKEEKTRYKYILYYGIIFVENTVFVMVWYTHHDTDQSETIFWFPITAILIHYALFIIAISFMISYYVCLHPTLSTMSLASSTLDMLSSPPPSNAFSCCPYGGGCVLLKRRREGRGGALNAQGAGDQPDDRIGNNESCLDTGDVVDGIRTVHDNTVNMYGKTHKYADTSQKITIHARTLKSMSLL